MPTRTNIESSYDEQFLKTCIFCGEDKNGTRRYVDPKCRKCGGSGWLYYYSHVDGGICFRCSGSGDDPSPEKIVIYTPEYKAKLVAKRTAKRKAEAEEKNRKLLEAYGFAPNTEKVYLILGNTYTIKDDLKAAGAKYNSLFGWYFSNPTDSKYPTTPLHYKDIFTANEYDELVPSRDVEIQYLVKELKTQAETNINRSTSLKEYEGEINVRSVFLISSYSILTTYDTDYGTVNVYKFITQSDNILIWKTHSSLPEGVTIIKATVKAHEEYKGIKQTVLSRVAVVNSLND